MNNNTTEPRQLRKVSQKYTRQSQIAMVMHNLAKNKGAMAGLAIIVLLALVLSCLFAWLPLLQQVSAGISIVICTVAAAAACAALFPIADEEVAE